MKKSEKLFLLLAGTFLASLIMANLIGVTKFFTFFGIGIPVGILPYPVTFLVTDLISELYGKERANFLVFTGLILSLFILLVMYLGYLAPIEPNWYESILNSDNPEAVNTYPNMFNLMVRGTIASMIAYLLAQFCDVRVFHYIKEKTSGKHLWLRNNLSTMSSQLIDSTAVILITFYGILPFDTIVTFIISGYLFKVFVAITDTPFFYLGVKYLKKYVDED